MLKLKDYTYLGLTQSLCPSCLKLVSAKIIERGGRVYFRKQCEACGEREDFVCSDVRLYDRMDFSTPAKTPRKVAIEPRQGCPYDCGLCTEHEQHTCIGLVELTSSCNLSCPMCYASSGPGGKHESFEACKAAIDRLVEVEGRPEVLQLSGGEPTVHPQFSEILHYACRQPIDYVQINTNGIRFARDPDLVATVAEYRDRLELFFQLDGLSEPATVSLRGEPLLEEKLRALDLLGEAGVHMTLACTLQGGVNDDQPGPLVDFAAQRPWITGVNFQPATYSGRFVLPEELEKRITFPDVVHQIVNHSQGVFRVEDFMPLPCAHPNCHSLSYAFRHDGRLWPLTRFIDARRHMDLLANGISLTRPAARNLVLQLLGRLGCCGGGECGSGETNDVELDADKLLQLAPAALELAEQQQAASGDEGMDLGGVAASLMDFLQRCTREEAGAEEVFRITITSFLDAYNFDVRRLMKCCTHHVLPSGHVIPFCAYNVLYRDGHVPLPELASNASDGSAP